MVEKQIRARGVRDERVLSAMEEVPREAFVPSSEQSEAYADRALSIPCRQTISQPYMVAAMTEALRLRPDDRVLEIGTGSGYQTAILSRLAKEVCTVERMPELQAEARIRLEDMGYRSIRYHVGDGTMGWPEMAPFDAILVTAGAPMVPEPLKAQLADGGRLVIPVGGSAEQTLTVIERTGDTYREIPGFACRFVRLIGEQGWSEE
jgi:protein-L-isoaspartate(D-aspartate) O-methyltransferase